MQKFNEYMFHQDINDTLAEANRIDELLGGLGQAASGMWQGIKQGMQGMQQGMQTGVQNASNVLQANKQKAEIQKLSGMVNNLQGGLKQIGFTDNRVHGVLNNINSVLKTGLGNTMKVGGQQVKFNPMQGSNAPNFNSRISQARNMYANNKMMQSGGTGI